MATTSENLSQEHVDLNYGFSDYDKQFNNVKKEKGKSECFHLGEKRKRFLLFCLHYFIVYVKYYAGKALLTYSKLLSMFVRVFVGKWKMTHEKFISIVENDNKHVLHYLINNESRLENVAIENLQQKRLYLLDYVLTQYTCRKNIKYQNNDLSVVNEKIIFSDPMCILRNKKEVEIVMKAISNAFSSKIDESNIKVTHYRKCIVLSFNVDWILLKNKLSVKPQILVIVLNDNNNMNHYQNDTEKIDDIRVLNENIKKEELTVYKTFPKKRDENKEEMIALYDFWMSDHHYSLYGYHKYIRRALGVTLIIASLGLNWVVDKYTAFINKNKKK